MVVSRSDFTLRDAMAQDEMFIELMLLAAANWLQDRQLSLEQMRSEPDRTYSTMSRGGRAPATWVWSLSIAVSRPSAPSGSADFHQMTRATATSPQTCLS